MITDKMRVDKAKFGKFIAKRREQLGYSNQTLLAEKLNLSTGGLGKIEAGERLPSFDTFIDLADALQMTPGELMMVLAEREEEQSPNQQFFEMNNWLYEQLKGLLGQYEKSLNPHSPGAASPMPVYRLEDVTEADRANIKEADQAAREEFKKRGLGKDKDKDKDNTASTVENGKPPEQI